MIERRGVLSRARPLDAVEGPDPVGSRTGDRDDLPGSDDGSDARVHRRLADRRADPGPHAPVRRQARARAIELLAEVGIANADRRVDDYPHQFSGGMRQRVMIAMALSCNPALLIADEPTTALDVTIQAQILDLLKRLRDDHGSAIVLITHDMGVVANVAERVAVMYAGRVVEEAPKSRLFRNPQHPYTWGLLGSVPRLDRPRLRRLVAIPGAPPSPFAPPEGCRFAPRCVHRFDLCSTRPELLERAEPGHLGRVPPGRRVTIGVAATRSRSGGSSGDRLTKLRAAPWPRRVRTKNDASPPWPITHALVDSEPAAHPQRSPSARTGGSPRRAPRRLPR